MRAEASVLLVAMAVGHTAVARAEGAGAAAPVAVASAGAAVTTLPVNVAPPSTTHRYTLKECLAFAENNYPKVHEAAAQLARMRAQVFEARTAPFSQFSAQAGVTLAPTVEGTALYSPNTDATITSSMALAWRVGVEGAVPLWTFGKISSAIEAANDQTKVGEQNVRKAKNEVDLSVRQAFYGVLLARDALALLDEAIGRVDKYLPQAQQKSDSGDGDDIPLLKLKIHRAELEARRSEATKEKSIALANLRFLTGQGSSLDVPDEPLRKVARPLGPVSEYLAAARLFRPEINMARAGVLARKAQLDLERARFYPDIAFAASASRSYAPEIADQLNPFVYDQANYTRYGLGLVVNWTLDFLPRAAKVEQAEAQLDEIRATERFALGGVGVEVETAFAEAQDASRRLDAFTEAVRYARQWLVKVQEGIDVGTFDDDEIVDPAKEYALRRFAQMSAILDYNVAMAKLALATGWDAVAPEE